MNHSREILTGPLCAALPAAAFSIWTALGNDVNFCVTAGCSLYQDAAPGGISLWWAGAGVFALLALTAILGAPKAGRLMAGLALLGDICLLVLMALTAPCVSCLVVAAFFALCYLAFLRTESTTSRRLGGRPRRSLLLWIWVLLFVVNLGVVARSQADVWAITDNGDTASVRMYFSPSCPSCREGVALLSGSIDTAFYPLAETDADVFAVARMQQLLNTGMSMADALTQARDTPIIHGLAAWAPDMLMLRFRMLCNKAHVFMAGSQSVPFFEYHGLPSMLVEQKKRATARASSAASSSAPSSPYAPTAGSSSMQAPAGGQSPLSGAPYDAALGQDAALPFGSQIAGQCGGSVPCPDPVTPIPTP